MKHFFLFIFFALGVNAGVAQTGEIKGVVKDANTGELLFGAMVELSNGKKALCDENGFYSIPSVPEGKYTVTVYFFSYDTTTTSVTVKDKPVLLNIMMEPVTLNEVEIVSSVAKIRETPVAFSNISGIKLQEDLASRDLPMVLNSTPGAYATEQGGGSGDARVTIRGFDQRNIAVMVDGVPVNDMENGWVYWSNWDGLGDATRNIQVQRGLGASRLAITSVGGTMNIITRGIESKRQFSIKQEYGNNLFLKTSLSINSGQLKGGWGVTFAGSRKTGNGWADETWTDAWSYFFKVQKRFKNHLISLSAVGAPQKHGQRTDRMPIAVYDTTFARKMVNRYYADSSDVSRDQIFNGMLVNQQFTTLTQGERGRKFNPHWGELNRGDGIEHLNEKVNYFHKPQINLTHFWNITENITLSNVLYFSSGNGGGTDFNSGVPRDTLTGQLILQQTYNNNSTFIDGLYSTSQNKSTRILHSSVNEHKWYGLLSTLTVEAKRGITAVFGIDGRYYKGIHYRQVYDLMGGDYYINTANKNQPSGIDYLAFSMKYEGDKIVYHNDAYVHWAGVFAQVEIKKEKWSAFATLTGSETGYQRRDYFRKKDLVLEDTTYIQAIGFADTVVHNGQTYTRNSPEAKHTTTERLWFLGYTIKGGANLNITAHQNVYVNLGYLTMPPRFNNVFDNNNKAFLEIKNQKVIAVEAGYGIHYKAWALNLNAYYTRWENKPPQFTPTVNIAGDIFSYNINGLTAIHKGVELDGVYKITRKLSVEGVISMGDWITDTKKKVYVYNADKELVDSVDFSAQNVHVGDAAQMQLGASVRYEIIKGLYVKANYTWFGKNYANFDPLTLTGNNADRESWKMPNYSLLDVSAGYEFTVGKVRMNLGANVMNVLDIHYMTDAQNGYDFNAATALVYFGQGRRFNTSFKITF